MVSFWIKSPFSAQPEAYRGTIRNCSKTERIDAIIAVGWIERGRSDKRVGSWDWRAVGFDLVC
jgi:hypothetical protein